MMKMMMVRVFGLHVFALSFSCFVLLAVPQLTDPSQVSALLAVKSSLNDQMNRLNDWKKGRDPCASNWTGIVCSETIGTNGYLDVRKIHLLNKNLSGSLAPELGQLSHLQILDFMWNELTGSIPKEIGKLSSLQLLLLNGNKLSGDLPDELGYLQHLRRLQVDENQISGPIPKSFSNLASVRHLHLNNNSISGQIPPELSNLSTLIHLLVDNNNLSGYLPSELSNIPNLRIIQLDNNNFRGAVIPAVYGNLSRLVKLSVRNCSLQGALPNFSKLSRLKYLDLSWNQLTGSIPSDKLSDDMTTIILSSNLLNGTIPKSFSDLPHLQTLSAKNNSLSGSFPASIWQNKFFNATARLTLDLQNNLLVNISGVLSPPANVTLRLHGNPVCDTANIENINQFCRPEAEEDATDISKNTSTICPIQACPVDNYFEYVLAAPVPCFCASPLRIGYRLKSPGFSYFPPYINQFRIYLGESLGLSLYQISVEPYSWEKGPRLRMYVKLFPVAGVEHSNTFNTSEILRIKDIFTSWRFPGDDLFGPYELLNFTLLGPYSDVAVACAVVITITATVIIIKKHSKNFRKLSRSRTSSKSSVKIDGVRSFSFEEMAMATNNFTDSTLVGQGGYGKVYRGLLSSNKIVAIKRAKEGSLQGEKEFLTEIELLSRLHHRNLVSLVGYCEEKGEQMLVYEFMPNGTLQYWLSAKSKEALNFGMRLHVALDSAKGILYLHTEANPPIFHRDIKASNILLDSNFTAKVADFGLSLLAPVSNDQGVLPDHVSTVVKGTPGYVDPEYFLTHKLTDKSDVYSLGVVFLEILTGMQPISHGKNIVREVKLSYNSGTMFSIIDSRMGSYPSECVERFLALALKCCQDKPEDRPSMLDVVRELENLLQKMPETKPDLSKPTYRESSSSASLVLSNEEYFASLNMSGSDLVSGVTTSIKPR
ncbi:putative LRR receptor-like serine/threonine-protein kinase At1g06840 isoform X2 [Apium graveolens]|uniref:putative LRR receptor-like serine/threonine-protein kinase At1g06840 isoform X2 n=1 Tax=Apium graveolens TaxID=4045 RepID=UPI003D7B42E9